MTSRVSTRRSKLGRHKEDSSKGHSNFCDGMSMMIRAPKRDPLQLSPTPRRRVSSGNPYGCGRNKAAERGKCILTSLRQIKTHSAFRMLVHLPAEDDTAGRKRDQQDCHCARRTQFKGRARLPAPADCHPREWSLRASCGRG